MFLRSNMTKSGTQELTVMPVTSSTYVSIVSFWSCLFQYFLCEACSCVVDLVSARRQHVTKKELSWHWGPTCEPPSVPCIRSLQVVVTLNVQNPRLTPRWHRSCKVHERESGKKKKKKMRAKKKLERICLSSFLLFLFLAKSGECIIF